MINKINNVNFVTKPMFKAQLKAEETKPETVQETVAFRGAEALAAYNAPILNKLEKLDIEPVELIDISNIDGEKIYSSDGKLYSITTEDENTKTEYFADDEGDIDFITVTDKKTGNVIKEQDMDDDSVFVNQYSAETGKRTAMTEYKNGEPVYTSSTAYKQDGTIITTAHNAENKSYSIYEYSADNKISRSIDFDSDKKLTRVDERKEVKSKTFDLSANFYNGAMISVRKSEEIKIPNTLGKEELNNPDFLPAAKFVITDDIKNAKGEKTYYSNGALEKNVTENGVEAYFKPDGTLSEIETADKDIKFIKNSQIIEENLEDGRTKTTAYYENGKTEVELKDNNKQQNISYDEKGNIKHFLESTLDENGEETAYKSLYFNEQGMLEDAFSY